MKTDLRLVLCVVLAVGGGATVLGVQSCQGRSAASAPAPPREPVKAQRVDRWSAPWNVEVTRQQVPGGWLYVTTIFESTGPGRWGAAGVSSVFVPDSSLALPVEKVR